MISGLGSTGQRKAHPPKESLKSKYHWSGFWPAVLVPDSVPGISRGMPDVEGAHLEGVTTLLAQKSA